MKKIIPAVLVVACLAVASTILYQKFLAQNPGSKVANGLVKMINAADHSGIENLFNKEMSQALPLERATEFFSGLTRHVGKIQRLDEPKPTAGRMVYVVHCERGTLEMSLALDDKNKIAGLDFKLPDAETRQTITQVANRLVELINAADYFGVEILFNKEMSQAMPLDKATEFFKGLSDQAGKIQKLGKPEPGSEGTVFPVHCEHAVLDMTLALDEQNRIAGLLFKPHVDRYTKVANRLVELINAADYSGIENLFNREMSVALPLEKATQIGRAHV